MLLDLSLPDMSGIDVLERLKEDSSEISTVVVSGTGDISLAVKAMQLGAYSYIEKPPHYKEVRMVVKKLIESQEMKNEIHFLRSEVGRKELKFGSIIGKSKILLEIFDTVGKASKTDATVLITGESGTGKELVAHAIHNNSHRNDKNFVVVGEKKTIKVDVRIIAATNRLLKDEIDNGNFREDLYFRLNVIPLILPPLRQRIDDIPTLIMHFIEVFRKNLHCKTSKFSSKATEAMQNYVWPGNVRELRNVIERVLSLNGDVETITPDLLPVELAKTNSSNTTGKMFELSKIDSLESVTSLIEKDLITQALQQANGNLSKAARFLQIDRWKLKYKLKKLHIKEFV